MAIATPFDRTEFRGAIAAADGRWRALLVGNSRWHWAAFAGDRRVAVWDAAPGEVVAPWTGPIALASVVDAAIEPALAMASTVQLVGLGAVPLAGLYPTLGIDRALALYGAGWVCGFPVLVVDAGTALTVSGADDHRQFRGGAILPGLGLQLRALAGGTAALPAVGVPLPDEALPAGWALETRTAIASGVGYGAAAAVADRVRWWAAEFPNSAVVVTGGDGAALVRFWRDRDPRGAAAVRLSPWAWCWGIEAVVLGGPTG